MTQLKDLRFYTDAWHTLLLELPLKTILELSLTCKEIHFYVRDDNALWALLTKRDFSLSQPIRQSGWRDLYTRLKYQGVYVWGENHDNRLGLKNRNGKRNVPTQLHRLKNKGVVQIAASGFGFYALTKDGSVYAWGRANSSFGVKWLYPRLLTLDIPQIPNQLPPLSRRRRLPPILQLSAAREHCVALDEHGDIWSWILWSQIRRLTFNDLALQGRILQIKAGWNWNACLIEDKGWIVWLESQVNTAYRQQRQRQNRNPTDEESNEDVTIHATLIPNTVKVEALCLTDSYAWFIHPEDGNVYRFALEAPNRFVEQLPLFKEYTITNGSSGLSHITGAFENFAVFNHSGIVLLGSNQTDQRVPPKVIPELQNRGVIDLSWGDWHTLALCENGDLLAWGSDSENCGCLGLGSPEQIVEMGGERFNNSTKMNQPMKLEVPFCTAISAVDDKFEMDEQMKIGPDEYESDVEGESTAIVQRARLYIPFIRTGIAN